MADRVAPRRPGMRTVLAIFAAVTVLVIGGVWFSAAGDRSDTVANAPKTAAAQKSHPARDPQEAKADDTAAPRELPGVRECGVGKPVVEPKIITLNCSNAGVVASDIKWDSFTADGADGSGTVLVSGTAGGSPASFPARLRLYDVTKVDGMMAFTGIEVSYTGATPHAKAKEVYTIA
ncbi:hypothetical protein [Streptomyces sp. NPDC008001]|uniref:hypothetical protein n=1 Tax=Streptomyces sp. NPDC008001 TaxID=3364804 RepID=UPI0036E4D0B5